MLWIGLNPSTADAMQDDPTIRRVVGFAKQFGYGSVLVGNLYALRATNPKTLREIDNPVGRFNDDFLRQLAGRSELILVGWGANAIQDRADAVMSLLRGYGIYCLGKTKSGHPKHPLYLRATPHWRCSVAGRLLRNRMRWKVCL